MDVLETPLGDEVKRIYNARAGQPNVYVDAVLHTKFGDVEVLRVLNLDIMREYTLQYTDETSIVLLIPAGQYAYRVAPSRNELEVTVSSQPLAQHGVEEMEAGSYGSQRFRAVLKEANDPTMEAQQREQLSEFTMDLADFEVVELQLFDKAMEQFSMRSCGGIYRKTAVGDLIRSLLLQQSQAVNVEEVYKPVGVDMVEPNDAKLRDHIVIPHGTMVYNAPGYIQQHCGGVYPAGLAYYYQDSYWYVFPPWNYNRFEDSTRQLVVNVVPEGKLPGMEHSFLVEGSVVNIIATGGLMLDDKSDLRKRTTGNGVRFADASKFFEGGVEVKGNKALASRGKSNNEFLSTPQKSELNNVHVASQRVTANTMYQASLLAAKEGVHIQVGWQCCDPALIRPGMQARVVYYKEGTVRTINAIVIGGQVATGYEGSGLVAGRFNRNMALHLFAANEANQQDEA